MTPAQQRALNELWPRYGIELSDALLDLNALFGRDAPKMLEIGFGNGDTLLALASANPQNDYLGAEVHRPGIGRLLHEVAARELHNLRVICVDVNDVFARLAPASLAAVYLFFPDPWPKKRHHKRRLLQSTFAEVVRDRLIVSGQFYLATDWEDYAVQMLSVLSQVDGLENVAGAGQYAARPEARPLTRFERRGQRLGHVVRDLIFEKR